MFQKININKILFLELETILQNTTFDELFDTKKEFFGSKTLYYQTKDQITAYFFERSGIWTEFIKIIYLSVYFFNFVSSHREFRVNTFYVRKKVLLIVFKNLLETLFNKAARFLYADNSKEFDFPYIAGKMTIQGLDLMGKLNLFIKKNWKAPNLYTLHLWRFWDYKYNTSLYLVAHLLGIPLLKNDIDNSQVTSVYYEVKKIHCIADYCKKHLITISKVLLRLRFVKLLVETEIINS